MKKLLLIYAIIIPIIIQAQDQPGYQVPPQPVADLVNAPQTPAVSMNSGGDWIALMERPGYISIEELAQPELRLAGLRINPRTNGPSRSTNYIGFTIKNIKENKVIKIQGMPENPLIQNVSWSPDGQKIAFTNMKTDGIELWILDLQSAKAKKVTNAIINAALGGRPFTWFSGSKRILFRSVLSDRGEAPEVPSAPAGPIIQETTGKKAPVRTYQDLLQNGYDEALFKFYATGQLMVIDLQDQKISKFADPGIYIGLSSSPNGKFVAVTSVTEPFSYIVPYHRFPTQVAIHDDKGKKIKEVANLPIAEDIPKGFGAVRTGPRSFTWRSDEPATLYWVEAQDGGDPSAKTDVRDQLFYLKAPFDQEKGADVITKLRYGGITWGDDKLAIVYEWWWNTREEITSSFTPGANNSKKEIFKHSFEDRYNNPGNFATTSNEFGRNVLLTSSKGNKLYLTGQGASPEGNRPFLREFDLNTGKTKQLWRSESPYYEMPIKVLDINKGKLLTRKESKSEPPNYVIRNIKNNKLTTLTNIPHPYPQLKALEKQVVNYKRKDGVDLKGDLYLPAGYKKEDGPLPVLMWAYPNEFKSAQAAGQVKGSPHEFIRLGWWSPLYFVTRGYAVFDDPSMPVVGEGETEPNDNFREQLVMNAQAAVDKLVEMGIADPNKFAIGGHSYGAFMTANLLAHSDLFAAGIARSGAYNRTLTPFGFQSEERTYWEAPEIYYDMSPFMHADKINEPMLMIHGEADNNSGTFPLQSKRMFAAMKGLGGNAKLVMLPHESHGYRAKESILHMLWEMDQLLEKYVKKQTGKSMDTKIKVGGK